MHAQEIPGDRLVYRPLVGPDYEKVRADLRVVLRTAWRVIRRLHRLHQADGGSRGQCPCHPDGGRALLMTVDRMHPQQIGLTCDAGCPRERLYAAFGLAQPQRWVM